MALSVRRHLTPEALMGVWRSDPQHRPTATTYGDVTMEFFPNGRLEYRIQGEDRVQVIRLSYEVDGTTLVTDQPSAPRREVTEATFDREGRLVLRFGGGESRFVRNQVGSSREET